MTLPEEARSTPRHTATPRAAALAFVIDAALVITFAAIGRGEHNRTSSIAGLFETSWPFLAGLAVAWLITRAWRQPFSVVRTGIPVWIGAVALGMLFRALSAQGTALPFVLVATGTLALFLLGWRLLAALVRRKRR